MSPLILPEKTLRPVCWRLLLLAACVLVFAFALHAKVSVYQQGSHIDTSTSSKLWLDGERQVSRPISQNLAVFCTFLLVHFLYKRPEGRFDAVYRAPVPVQLSQLYLHRFLRPPTPRRQAQAACGDDVTSFVFLAASEIGSLAGSDL